MTDAAVPTTREEVVLGGRTFSYLRAGSDGGAAPLVLLHSLALSGEMWQVALGEFAEGREVIALDLRGHGGSSFDGRPFTVADMAEDVVGFLDDLRIEAADVLGLSMGGSVALTLAGSHPSRVRRLVACDTTAWYGPDAPSAWAARARTAATTARISQLAFQIERWYSPEFRRNRPDVVALTAGIFQRTRPRVHEAACLALGALDSRHLLAGVTAPTLCITGEADLATPPEMGAYAAERVADGTFLLAPGLKHFAILESAGLRRQALAFFDGAGTSAPSPVPCCQGTAALEAVGT